MNGRAVSTDRHEISLTVNGSPYRRSVESRLLLSDFLRHDLLLAGTHVGCEHGVCGACTVIVDGAAVRSCLMFAAQADGRSITTVEGLAPDRSAETARAHVDDPQSRWAASCIASTMC